MIALYDRGPDGSVIAMHSAAGYVDTYAANASTQVAGNGAYLPNQPYYLDQSAGPDFTYNRADGITDAILARELAMEYQLVIQFKLTREAGDELDELVAIEDRLEALGGGFEVDGHDIGSGEMNIFIITKDPRADFERIRRELPGDRWWAAAYRSVNNDLFTVLEPASLDEFSVK